MYILHYAKLSESGKGKDDMCLRSSWREAFKEHFDAAEWLVWNSWTWRPFLGGGNSKIFGIFTPIWGNDPFWLIFFKGWNHQLVFFFIVLLISFVWKTVRQRNPWTLGVVKFHISKYDVAKSFCLTTEHKIIVSPCQFYFRNTFVWKFLNLFRWKNGSTEGVGAISLIPPLGHPFTLIPPPRCWNVTNVTVP